MTVTTHQDAALIQILGLGLQNSPYLILETSSQPLVVTPMLSSEVL